MTWMWIRKTVTAFDSTLTAVYYFPITLVNASFITYQLFLHGWQMNALQRIDVLRVFDVFTLLSCLQNLRASNLQKVRRFWLICVRRYVLVCSDDFILLGISQCWWFGQSRDRGLRVGRALPHARRETEWRWMIFILLIIYLFLFLRLVQLNVVKSSLPVTVGMSLMMQVATELKIIAKDFNVAVLVSIYHHEWDSVGLFTPRQIPVFEMI